VAEPGGGQGGHPVQGAGLLEQVAGPGNDLEDGQTAQLGLGLAVALQHQLVVAADDQQGRGPDLAEAGAAWSGRPPRDTTAPTWPPRSALAHRAAAAPVLAPKNPTGRPRASGWACSQRVTPAQSSGQQLDVEHLGAVALFGRGEQVHQRGGQPAVVEEVGDLAVAGAVAAAAGAVGEDHDPDRGERYGQVSGQLHGTEVDAARPGGILGVGVGAGRGRCRLPGPHRNALGVTRATTSSAASPSAVTVSGGATGTARMMRWAPRRRRTAMAARAVAPVASPSSTTITVRP
jgi:hypothetical protein